MKRTAITVLGLFGHAREARVWHPVVVCWVLLAAVALIGCAERSESGGKARAKIELVRGDDQRAIGFDVVGLDGKELKRFGELTDEARGAVVTVFVIGTQRDVLAMLGETSLVEDRLRFTPRYPLEAGMGYRVVVTRGILWDGVWPAPPALEADFKIPKPTPANPTVVEHIYPSSDELPENLLKFYIHFSAPMSRGDVYRRLHLLDGAGKEIEYPFLELGEELWDPEMRRFTLLFDPGRIKRGLRPREEVGAVLEAGHDYTLVVDREWLDAASNPLAAEARKSFHVLPPDEKPVDATTWKIEPPAAGTSDPLSLRFSEPLDHSLLMRVVWITSADGQKIAGTAETIDKETAWRFTPNSPWQAGDYNIVAATTLEDTAGNSIGRAFDVDVFERVDATIPHETISIPFKIGEPAK